MLETIVGNLQFSRKRLQKLAIERKIAGFQGVPKRLSMQYDYFLTLKTILRQTVEYATNDKWSQELAKKFLFLTMLEDHLEVFAGNYAGNVYFKFYEENVLYYAWKIVFLKPKKFENFLKKIS